MLRASCIGNSWRRTDERDRKEAIATCTVDVVAARRVGVACLRRPPLTIPAGHCGWWFRFLPAAPPIFRRAYSDPGSPSNWASRSSSTIARAAAASSPWSSSPRAPPNGYTLLLGPMSGLTMNPALFSKLPYDSVKDFAPISMTSRVTLALAASPSLPANSVKELIALAKASPGKISYGSTGIGNVTHLAGEMLKSLAGIDLVHVPYKGAGPQLIDVMSGNVADRLHLADRRDPARALGQAEGPGGDQQAALERGARHTNGVGGRDAGYRNMPPAGSEFWRRRTHRKTSFPGSTRRSSGRSRRRTVRRASSDRDWIRPRPRRRNSRR